MSNLQLSDSQNRVNSAKFGGRLFMILLLAAVSTVGCNESVQAPELVSCALDTDCADRTDGKTKCDTASQQCVKPQSPQPECSGDNDCADRTDGKTKCDTASQRCIEPQLPQPECSGDNDCADRTDGKTKCDTASQRCIEPQLPQPECSGDNDCADRTDGKTKCDTASQRCIEPQLPQPECSGDNDCADRTDGKTKCDTASQRCIEPQLPQPECSGDSDCANRTDGKTKCDTASQRCIEPQLPQPECSGDSDCANRTDGKTKCDTASQQCIDPQLPQPECGNNQIETGESCDSADLNLKSCLDFGFNGGSLACGNNCIFDTSGCFECIEDDNCNHDAAKPYCRNHVCVPKCGNNQLDDDEACDGTLFRGGVLSCSEYSGSFNTGMLSCTSECEIDDSACGNIQLSECGNNYLNDNEDCDGSLFKNNATSCSSWNEYYNTGNVSCHDCTIDYSNCKYCLSFVDDEIKKYALSNWDTNRDGCIAREEAASVTEIPFQAFENNEQLKTLDDLKQFPNLKRIGDFAFDGCKSLTSVDLPQVTAIYSDVFNKCTSLTSVNLPQVTIIGDRAFYDCSSLTSINSPQVTMIGEAAFYSCTSVKSIDFPNVATVGERAFSKCTSLTSVDWPNLTELASSTFSVCTSLKTVKLPKLNKIGTDVFYNCPKLTSLSLTSPDKIKSNVNKPFSEFSSNQCTLTLNENKKSGGTSEPQVEADGKTWFGALWKEIIYSE